MSAVSLLMGGVAVVAWCAIAVQLRRIADALVRMDQRGHWHSVDGDA